MKAFHLLPLHGFVLAWLAGALAIAEEPEASVESILVKWEETFQGCRTLDARVTVLHYERIFGQDRLATKQARFYYEVPDFTRYEITECREEDGRGSSQTPEALVWTSEGLFLVDHRRKTCTFWSSEAIAAVRQRMEPMPERTPRDRFWKGYASLFTWPACFAGPDDLLPLLVPANRSTQRQLFDFTAEHHDGQIVLKAVPKQKNEFYREVDVLLDGASYQPIAHRLIHISGDKTVHIFDEIKINRPPSDRARLMEPVPIGYPMVRAEDMLFAKKDGSPEPAR